MEKDEEVLDNSEDIENTEIELNEEDSLDEEKIEPTISEELWKESTESKEEKIEPLSFINEEEKFEEDKKYEDNVEVNLISEPDQIDQEIDKAMYVDKREDISERELTRREKRKAKKIAKLKARYLNPIDIKYHGILSYRHLRIIAWIAIALSQFLLLNAFAEKLFDFSLVSGGWQFTLDMFSSLSLPLFLIASFSLILNNNKSNKSIILTYLCLYLAISLGVLLVYFRYINLVYEPIARLSGREDVAVAFGEIAGKKAEVNVFSDLLALSLFNYFLTYTPKKFFQGKKLLIFRWFAILPIIVAAVSYVIKVLSNMGDLSLPFYVYPFLTTKPPLMYLLFVILSFWIKNREKRFVKIGATKEDYKRYLKTNRNTLSFSGHLSIMLLVISVIDIIATVIALIPFTIQNFFYVEFLNEYKELALSDEEMFLMAFDYALNDVLSIGIGESSGLFFAIPFVMLFSYTRKHENNAIDILIPLAGIGIVAFTYLETIYQIVIRVTA